MTASSDQGEASYEYVKETTLLAEQLGFATLLLAEHFIHPNGATLDLVDAWTSAAGLAALTAKVGTNGGTTAGLVGTPEMIAERLRHFESLGIETFLLQFHPTLEELQRFGAEVMPLLRN